MNPGVDGIMRFLGLGARLGRRFASEGDRAEMRGMRGTMNVEFREPESIWHVSFDDDQIQIAPGAAPDPRATVRIRSQDFLALIAGDLSGSIARMTGKVRVSGDGHFGLLFGGMVGALLNAQRAGGVPGWITRRAVARALRQAGYTRKPRAEKAS
jgi:putative sterol carrier protein